MGAKKVQKLCINCGHDLNELALVCNNCGRTQISFAYTDILVFILSILSTVILFRLTGSIWPVYLILSIGIIHLYSVIFSEGQAIRSGTVLLALSILAWIGWYLVPPDVFEGQGEVVTLALTFTAIGIWIFGILYAIYLGRRKVVSSAKLASSYFLGTGAFLFGLWGIWGLVLENEIELADIFQIAVGFVVLVPMVILIRLLIVSPRKEAAGEKDVQIEVSVLWLLALSAYLSTTQWLADQLVLVFGDVMPHLLDRNPVHIDMPELFGILKWRYPVTGVFSALAIIILIRWSIKVVTDKFEYYPPRFFTEALSRLESRRASTNPISFALIGIEGAALIFINLISRIANLLSKITIVFIEKVISTLRRVFTYLGRLIRYIIIPVLAFSLLSLTSISVLHQYRLYFNGIGGFEPLMLWGAGISVLILVILLSRLSFGFTQLEIRQYIFAGTEAALYLGALAFFAVSVAATGLILIWYGLNAVNIDFSGVRPGPIYQYNFIAIIVLMVILVVTEFLYQRIESSSKLAKILPTFTGLRVVLLVALAIYVAYLGLEPGIARVVGSFF